MNLSSIVCIWLVRSIPIRSFSGSALPILTFLPGYFALTLCFAAFLDFCLEFSYCIPLQLTRVIMHHHTRFATFIKSLPSSSITSGSRIQHTLTSGTYNFRNKSKLQWHLSLRAKIYVHGPHFMHALLIRDASDRQIGRLLAWTFVLSLPLQSAPHRSRQSRKCHYKSRYVT
jgi:hypothetical protein